MDELQALNRRLVAACIKSDGAYYRWARQSKVTLHTLDVLYALDDGQPHSQKQVCEEWALPKTTVNTVVNACRKAGYITLEDMPDQPRQRRLCLTEAGRAYARETLAELHELENQAMAEAVARFGPAFVEAIEFCSARFCAAVDSKFSKKEEN